MNGKSTESARATLRRASAVAANEIDSALNRHTDCQLGTVHRKLAGTPTPLSRFGQSFLSRPPLSPMALHDQLLVVLAQRARAHQRVPLLSAGPPLCPTSDCRLRPFRRSLFRVLLLAYSTTTVPVSQPSFPLSFFGRLSLSRSAFFTLLISRSLIKLGGFWCCR